MASQRITLNVEGMSCGHCSGMVKKTLEEMEGVSNISVSLDEKKAFFDADDTPDLVEKAIKEVTEAGYKASST
ncbi:MAG: heavy-metal-associated domain-containing protein [Deltaproteobacteria bacterium]|uniref:heavy-metal-associated domain-containing protein n=1 Tax=Desulfobacula sp. TaxID=2593537 RepID=UPI0019BB51D9|nr:heavy-metal-associated domain-containing protein [Candidatus Desulfobacula maris]MBL6993434.1 heavy-metal-associated domain-containing protein [Desulfobacula sp.]